MMNSFVEMTLSQNDKRLLFVLLIVFVILFVLLGLIGALIRKVSTTFAARMDYEIHEAVTRRVIETPEQLKRYGRAKNRRRFFIEAIPPFCIALLSLLIYLVTSFATGIWARDYFKEFTSLFFVWDWASPTIHTKLFGIDVISDFPPLLHGPQFFVEELPSYILVPVWCTSIIYYIVVIQAYVARSSMLNKRAHTVFEKSLEGFNHFDDIQKKDTNAGAQNNQ